MTTYDPDRAQIHLRILTEQRDAIRAVSAPGLNTFNSKAEHIIALGLWAYEKQNKGEE